MVDAANLPAHVIAWEPMLWAIWSWWTLQMQQRGAMAAWCGLLTLRFGRFHGADLKREAGKAVDEVRRHGGGTDTGNLLTAPKCSQPSSSGPISRCSPPGAHETAQLFDISLQEMPEMAAWRTRW